VYEFLDYRARDFVSLPVTIQSATRISDAERILEEKGFKIMRRSVCEIMSRNPLSVRPLTPLIRVLQKMIDTRNKSFPVVDGARVVGVVTRENIMRALRLADAGQRVTEGTAPLVQ